MDNDADFHRHGQGGNFQHSHTTEQLTQVTSSDGVEHQGS